MSVTRRGFIKASGAATAGFFVMTSSGFVDQVLASPLIGKLSDPAGQPKFVNEVPNALAPGFRYTPGIDGEYTVGVGEATHYTGLTDRTGRFMPTRVYGYGQGGAYTWPGKTFEVRSGESQTVVNWNNELFGINKHLLPVDTSLHWAYSLPGYEKHSIGSAGIPIVAHLHGGHTDYQYDGNPEFFFSPGAAVVGPQWAHVPGGFTNRFEYDNNVAAGNLWYHDHALGITRLNVYAGMAGFYFVRDDADTGQPSNPLELPAFPYEMALGIQDRMFKKGGHLFYPGFNGDPFWADFITDQGLKNGKVPKPSALAEFFGDHMVVNGLIWPKATVEPRHYRLRLLNGCDSRFMVVRFRAVPLEATDLSDAGLPLPFHVIGSDQGLASAATQVDTLVFEPGGRYDVVFDFSQVPADSRVIMENIGGDAPFGGTYGHELDDDDFFDDRQTDRIMAFDVTAPFDSSVPDAFNPSAISQYRGNSATPAKTRRVALFEGTDEYGRLQPLLGTAEPTPDGQGEMIDGSVAWHMPTTERPQLGDTEIWEIYNATGDAHPVHIHLVNFEILDRHKFTADSIERPVLQHNGESGSGFRLENIELSKDPVDIDDAYVENAPKDMVTALPEQVTRIKATFDKPGRYVWHCHILSHEDHEMMRVMEVTPRTG